MSWGRSGPRAPPERLGSTARTFESTDLNSRRANIEAAVDEAPTLIVLTTFEFTELGQEFAEANPDQPFILIDACPDELAPNLHCREFREYEGSDTQEPIGDAAAAAISRQSRQMPGRPPRHR